MAGPEALAISPERAVAPKGVEVAPHPIPSFDGENVSEVRDAFVANLNLVSGGDVVSTAGATIRTDGILGSAKVKIDTRLEQINLTSQALAAEREQFGKGRFRGPRAVRELEQEQRRTSQIDNKALSENRRNVKEQHKKIDKLCKDRHIDKEQQTKYDSLIAVEEYLANNGSTDLEPIRPNLEVLGWATSTPDEIKILFVGSRTFATGYEQYKTLKIGQGEGDTRVKGLRDFEAETQAAEEQRNANSADITSRLEAAKTKTREWEKRNAEFRAQDTPEQRRLKTSHALITKIEEYLGPHYIPDADRLNQVGTSLVQAKEKVASVKTRLAEIAGIVGGKAAKFAEKKAPHELLGETEKQITDLEKERQKLADPVKRLTQDGAPRELKAMVKKVQARDFDLTRVRPQEKILAETVMALLGKGAVTVEEQAAAEVVVTAGDIPEVAGPTEAEMAATEAVTATTPESWETPAENIDALARLAMAGALTTEQLQTLPQNSEASNINNALIDPAYFGGLETDLKTSLAAAKSGRPGISPEDLSLLTVDALRRAATHLGTGAPDNLVNFDELRSYITFLSKTPKSDPAKKAQLDEALRLLTVAETANRIRLG